MKQRLGRLRHFDGGPPNVANRRDPAIGPGQVAGAWIPYKASDSTQGTAVTSKAAIVERLGEKAVLLPSLVGDALAANDRIKFA